MKRCVPIAGLMAVTLTLSNLGNSPCQALDVASYLTAMPSATSVDERQSQIQKRLTEAVFAGRLKRAEGQVFSKDLDRIGELEASYRTSHGRLTLWENLKLLFELDTLSRKIELALVDRSVPDVSIDSRLLELQERVKDALVWNRLTRQEADGFGYELDRVRALYKLYDDGSGKNISDQQALQIGLELDRLAGRLENTMHDRQLVLPEVDRAQADVEKQIEEAVKLGKLTDAEAKAIRAEFQVIADKEAKLKELGRPLSSDETLALAVDLEKLSNRLDVKLRDQKVVSEDYGQKKAKIRNRIAGGIVTGKLTLAETHYLRDQLRRIEQQEKKWGKESEKLGEEAQKALLLEIEKLANAVERRLLDNRFTWKGVGETMDDISSRIEKASEAGRITGSQEKTFRKDLERARKIWQQARSKQDPGLYLLDESMQVAVALDTLNRVLVEGLKDRDLELPKLEQRKDAIDKRIASGIVSGRLIPWEADRLIGEFESIVKRENAYRSSQSELTNRDSLAIALRFEQLSARIERGIRDGSKTMPPISQRKQDLKEDIEEGIIAGKLAESEADDYSLELERLEESVGGSEDLLESLSARQALKLALDLHDLKVRLNRALGDVEIGMPDVEKRRRDLFARISGGVTSGRLSEKEARELRSEFAQIESMRKRYLTSGGISRGEGATLAYKIERLASKIEERMHDTQIQLPSIARLQDELDKRLAESVALGQLTLSEVVDFKKQLEQIGRMEMAFRYTGDGLSYPETLMLSEEIEKLSKGVDSLLAGKNSAFNGIDDRLDKTANRIVDALLSKKIDVENADQLKSELDRISKAKIAFAHSLGGFDLDESETLVRDLDRLNSEIDLRVKGQNFAWSDIDRREANIERTLNQNLKLGKIDKNKASKVKDELDKIRRAKAAFSLTDGGLNYFERVSIGEALDKLNNMIKGQIK